MESALTADARAALEATGGADLLVGIPSFNNAATIGHVVQVAAAGLARYFPDLRAAVLNSDGGSTDATSAAVRTAEVPAAVGVFSLPYQGPSGKGTALHAIFEAAHLLGARACVLLDSDLRSVTPNWVDRLARPIVTDQADYVAPLYTRHKYDGTITNNLAYPLTRALYGLAVRQPIGGDFGVGANVIATYVQEDVWDTAVARFGIDIWMTTTAIAGRFRVAQAALGAKIHDPKDPAASLGPMFVQVVGTLFAMMSRYAPRWTDIRQSTAAGSYGTPIAAEPDPVVVDEGALVARFRDGWAAFGTLWRDFLAPSTLDAVGALARQTPERFTFPVDVWVRAVYDFAVSHHRLAPAAEDRRIALLEALTPLYFGRTAGLVADTRAMDETAFEDYIEAQARVFEREKPYLVEQWHARPDR
jgi:glucosylglycerate synthase